MRLMQSPMRSLRPPTVRRPQTLQTLEVEDHARHRADAVEIIGLGLQAQPCAAVAGQAAKSDVLGSDFEPETVNPVLLVGKAAIALAVHPLIAGRRNDKAAFTGATAGAARDSIFPVNVPEPLADIAPAPHTHRPHTPP